MKKIASTLLASGIAVSSLMAADAAVTAVKVDGSIEKVTYKSNVWKKAKFSDVTLYPQTTIKMNDKKANELNADNKAKKAKVGAIHNGKQIAFMIKWPDGTMNIQSGYKSDSYGDGFAVQLAADYADAAKLPYIGMGSEGRPVIVHLQKAVKDFYEPNGQGNVYYQMNRNQTELFEKDLKKFDKKVKSIGSSDYERTFVSEGFRSMSEIKDASNSSYARLGYDSKAKGWKGTVSRSLKDSYLDLNAGAVPVAFAVWDGAKMGRDGLKHLTSWVSVNLEGVNGGDALISGLAAAEGDAANGKEQAIANCAACHKLGVAEDMAPDYMAPSLANIGGYSTSAYLKESMVDPSAVVVPGYNRNAHKNFAWYNEVDGKRVSTMPAFDWMDEKSMNDIIAFMQTLKAEVE